MDLLWYNLYSKYSLLFTSGLLINSFIIIGIVSLTTSIKNLL